MRGKLSSPLFNFTKVVPVYHPVDSSTPTRTLGHEQDEWCNNKYQSPGGTT